jgi:hypothetical protein
MASAAVLSSELGSITGSTPDKPKTGAGCGSSVFENVSILRFGKSLPLVELFETFMIVGLIMMAVTGANYYTFHQISSILKSEGGSQASVNTAESAARAQPVWIAVGFLIFLIGILLYYLHRRIVSSSS